MDITVYNAESFLQRAIDSVLAQTYTQWSLICVNDGSTYSSLKMLNENAAKDARINDGFLPKIKGVRRNVSR